MLEISGPRQLTDPRLHSRSVHPPAAAASAFAFQHATAAAGRVQRVVRPVAHVPRGATAHQDGNGRGVLVRKMLPNQWLSMPVPSQTKSPDGSTGFDAPRPLATTTLLRTTTPSEFGSMVSKASGGRPAIL